jgi:hypothetical protein
MTKEISQDTIRRLEQVLSSEYDSVKQNLMFSTPQGYELFDVYTISKTPNGATVQKSSSTPIEFTSTKSAVSWCIADKYNQFRLADEIMQLDKTRRRLREDVLFSQVYTRQLRDATVRETASLKLQVKQDILQSTETGLEKCANLAKYWQLRGFSNEIERTRRPASNSNYRSNIRVASR